MGQNFGRDVKRGALAVLTSGTSEIKTGGGEYGDETVADTIFPKFINNWALEDREGERARVEAAKKAEKAAIDLQKPTEIPDLAAAAKKKQLLALLKGQGRASTFLTGPAGDTTAPALGVPKLNGG